MKKITASFIGALSGAAVVSLLAKGQKKEEPKGKAGKFKQYYKMLNQWLMLKQEGGSLAPWFLKKGYRTAAVYGMGEMGGRLCDELSGSGITVSYGIDREPGNTYSEVEVRTPEESLEPVDVVVVTAVFAFEDIRHMLQSKISAPVCSLEDIIYESLTDMEN